MDLTGQAWLGPQGPCPFYLVMPIVCLLPGQAHFPSDVVYKVQGFSGFGVFVSKSS